MRIILAALVGVALSFQPAHAQKKDEPSYQGKTLSAWAEQLKSPQIKPRVEAMKAINAMKSKQALPHLLEALNSRTADVHQLARVGLVELGEDAVPALISVSQDLKHLHRSLAVALLGEIGPKARPAAPVLIKFLQTKDSGVEYTVIDSLGRIGDPAAIAVLEEIVKSEPKSARAGDATRALRRIEVANVEHKKDRLTLKGHTAAVMGLAFTRDGARLASGARDDTVKLWDLKTGDVVGGFKTPPYNAAGSLLFSPDDRLLLVGSGYSQLTRNTTVWELAGPRSLQRHGVRMSDVPGVGLLAGEGKDQILIASEQTKKADDGFAKLWNLGDKETRRIAVNEGIIWFAVSRDGQRAALGHEKLARVIDLTDGKEIVTLPGVGRTGFAFTPDGKRVLAGRTFAVEMWDLANEKMLFQARPGPETTQVQFANLSPNGKVIAASAIDAFSLKSKQNDVYLWHADSGKLLAICKGHTAPVNNIQFSPDGRTMATASQDQTIKLWDMPKE